jgi:hypothetical protein
MPQGRADHLKTLRSRSTGIVKLVLSCTYIKDNDVTEGRKEGKET